MWRLRLEELLVGELYGGDLEWVEEGKLIGLPEVEWAPGRTSRRGREA